MNILEGQSIVVGDASIMVGRIDFNSTRSFIEYKLLADGSTPEQVTLTLRAGEMIQLLPEVILSVLRIVKAKETYAVLEFDAPDDIFIMRELTVDIRQAA